MIYRRRKRSQKQLLEQVAQQYQVSVAAVDSGIRRLIDQLEEQCPPAWQRFKLECGLGRRTPDHRQTDLWAAPGASGTYPAEEVSVTGIAPLHRAQDTSFCRQAGRVK